MSDMSKAAPSAQSSSTRLSSEKASSARVHPTPFVNKLQAKADKNGSCKGADEGGCFGLFTGSMRGVAGGGGLVSGRRGVAGVVVTILMVLITITSVTLVGGFILNFVKNPGLSPAIDCFNTQLESGIVLERACYNAELDEVEVKVARSLDEDLALEEFVLIVTGTEDSASWACGQSCGSCDMLASGETKTFSFSLDDDFGELESVGVRVGTCGVDEIALQACS